MNVFYNFKSHVDRVSVEKEKDDWKEKKTASVHRIKKKYIYKSRTRHKQLFLECQY